MALVRILVDGYNLIYAWQGYRRFGENQTHSLLHSWPELAPGQARYSAAAREELIHRLRLYQDTIGMPITIFFDGAGPRAAKDAAESTSALEVLFSRSGQTADQMIERAAHRFAPYGEVMVVTDDLAERETVLSLGGLASSCWNFIQDVENTLTELADDIKHHNRQERNRFQRRR